MIFQLNKARRGYFCESMKFEEYFCRYCDVADRRARFSDLMSRAEGMPDGSNPEAFSFWVMFISISTKNDLLNRLFL